jgi:hypothetical protein
MEILIKYRNERKKEGASIGELSGLDGRINSLFSDPSSTFDLELLIYRRTVLEEGGSKEFLARIDKQIFHTLGSKPANIIDITVETISKLNSKTIAVDLNNETIGSLGKKAASALGVTDKYKLIFLGKAHESLDLPLSSTNLKSGNTVIVFKSINIKDLEIARNYNMLCDSFYRDTTASFKHLSTETIKELFIIASVLKTEKMSPCEVFCTSL